MSRRMRIKRLRLLMIRCCPFDLFVPALARVREIYPGAEISVLAQGGIQTQIEALEGISRVVPIPDGLISRRALGRELLRRLRRERFDLVIVPMSEVGLGGLRNVYSVARAVKPALGIERIGLDLNISLFPWRWRPPWRRLIFKVWELAELTRLRFSGKKRISAKGSPERILLFRTCPMELFAAALARLREKYPSAEVTVFTQNCVADEVRSLEGVDGMMPAPDGMMRPTRIGLSGFKRLRTEGFDLVAVALSNPGGYGYGHVNRIAHLIRPAFGIEQINSEQKIFRLDRIIRMNLFRWIFYGTWALVAAVRVNRAWKSGRLK